MNMAMQFAGTVTGIMTQHEAPAMPTTFTVNTVNEILLILSYYVPHLNTLQVYLQNFS